MTSIILMVQQAAVGNEYVRALGGFVVQDETPAGVVEQFPGVGLFAVDIDHPEQSSGHRRAVVRIFIDIGACKDVDWRLIGHLALMRVSVRDDVGRIVDLKIARKPHRRLKDGIGLVVDGGLELVRFGKFDNQLFPADRVGRMLQATERAIETVLVGISTQYVENLLHNDLMFFKPLRDSV